MFPTAKIVLFLYMARHCLSLFVWFLAVDGLKKLNFFHEKRQKETRARNSPGPPCIVRRFNIKSGLLFCGDVFDLVDDVLELMLGLEVKTETADGADDATNATAPEESAA